jgi:cellulose synthase/poly-beta-1,6-N-acetylglucosamine synthase-like glycosyltransferase
MIASSFLADALRAFNFCVLVYFTLITLSYMLVTAFSAAHVRAYFRRRSASTLRRMLRSRTAVPVTICVPAYNEQDTIAGSIRAMLTLEYSRYEIILANDGSTDGTLAELIASFDLRRVDQPIRSELPTAPVLAVYRSCAHPNLVVIDKVNGGRADAVNACINASTSRLICCVDADSIIEHDGLLAAVAPFVDRPETTVAAGGIIRVANGCVIDRGHVAEVRLPRNPLAMFQTVEYMRAFVAARTGWSALNGLLIISGAFGVFRRRDVAEVGGFAADSIGEDFELCLRLHRRALEEGRDYRLEFVPDPVCWTEVPQRLRDLGGQRDRWHRGLIDTLWRHRVMIGNPRYGAVGMLALPFFVLFEFLGAFIETLGYIAIVTSLALGVVNIQFAVTFLAVALLAGLLLSISAVLLEDLAFRRYGRLRDLLRLVLFGVLENLGYRQLVTAYRLRGFFSYLRGNKTWGDIQRVGFGPASASSDSVSGGFGPGPADPAAGAALLGQNR